MDVINNKIIPGFWYVATPYRGHPAGLEAGFEAACRYTAALMDAGVEVYSPIAHSHPISQFTRADPKSDYWLQRQLPYMAAARGMIIAKIPGWNRSSGIQFEKDWFSARGRPIFILSDPLPDPVPGGFLCR